MNSLLEQFPCVYDKDNSNYRYYGDDGREFVLKAGEDGVTEKDIAELKIEHRIEVTQAHRHKAYRKNGDEYVCTMASLETLSPDAEVQPLFGPYVETNPEKIAIAQYEEERFCKRMQKAMSKLRDGQKQLFMMAFIDEIPQREIAQMLGVTESAVSHRLNLIKEIVSPIFAPGTGKS